MNANVQSVATSGRDIANRRCRDSIATFCYAAMRLRQMSGLTFTDEQLKSHGVFQLRQPPTYFWRPNDDITTLELAKCMPMFIAGMIRDYPAIEQCYESLPEDCKRHWEVKSA